MSKDFDLGLLAVKPALLSGSNNTVDILVRVVAPDAPKERLPERPPLNLAIVIDRSRSMTGGPLAEAKRAAEFMINGLTPADRACVVAYDDTVRVLARSRRVEDKEQLTAAVRTIEAGMSTNLHGGWLQGAEELAAHLSAAYISRVLLLSDGQANHGVTDTNAIVTRCAALAETGITTSTYGLGISFNEDLMLAMARAGRGNGYYSETAESLVERFQEEFSLLAFLCARNVRLSLAPVSGATIEMLNSYKAVAPYLWRLPDLAYDGEGWAAIRLSIPAAAVPAPGESLAVLEASLHYDDLDGKPHDLPGVRLRLPAMDGEQHGRAPVDQRVITRVTEAEGARLQECASNAGRRGDWSTVETLLERARQMAEHSSWLKEVVKSLEELAAQRDDVAFSKEAAYGSDRMMRGLRGRDDFDAPLGAAYSATPAHFQKPVRAGGRGDRSARTAMPATEAHRLDQFDDDSIAVIDGKRVLLETGSPLSIGNGSSLPDRRTDVSAEPGDGSNPPTSLGPG